MLLLQQILAVSWDEIGIFRPLSSFKRKVRNWQKNCPFRQILAQTSLQFVGGNLCCFFYPVRSSEGYFPEYVLDTSLYLPIRKNLTYLFKSSKMLGHVFLSFQANLS